jgi:putrescine transport system permease protein
MKKLSFSTVMLHLGMAFLYIPMLIMVIYSFNESKLVTVWGGFSVKWYGALFEDKQLLDSVFISLKIAFFSAFTALFLGTLTAFVMTRFKPSFGKFTLSSMVTAPLVMPEVITGLSLMLLFVAMSDLLGWPAERGIVTIWIAHSTFCAAYVAVVLSTRLRELDRSIEEAALDLGAPPLKTFIFITLPMISPSLVAGWFLSFSLSLDDLVIASFVSGPGSTTLPMTVFSSVRLGVSPKINALAAIMIMTVSILALVCWYLSRRKEKRDRMQMNMMN